MSKKSNKKTVNQLPSELRGPVQNKYGGHQSQNMRVFKGSKFGAASPCRSLTEEEIETLEARLRNEGVISYKPLN